MIDGIAQNKASLPATFPVGPQTYKPDDVSALLQKRITLGKAVVTAAAALEAALKAESDEVALMKLPVDTFRKLVTILFLQSPDTLRTFGLTAPKPKTTSVVTKAEGVTKSTAKRKAKKAAVDAIDAGVPAPATAATATPAATPATAPAPQPAAATASKSGS